MSFQDTLEMALEKSTQELYSLLFNHSPRNVSCCYISSNIVAIVLEYSTTAVEQLLLQGGYLETAQAFRYHLNLILENRLIAMVSNDYQHSVSDILSQHHTDSKYISMLIIIEPSPSSDIQKKCELSSVPAPSYSP